MPYPLSVWVPSTAKPEADVRPLGSLLHLFSTGIALNSSRWWALRGRESPDTFRPSDRDSCAWDSVLNTSQVLSLTSQIREKLAFICRLVEEDTR